MIDNIRPPRIQEKEIQADLARLEMEQALRSGNIYEVMKKLPAGLTIKDFENFMGSQWKTFMSQIVQEPAFVGEAAMMAPEMRAFAVHEESAAFKHGEGKEFLYGMLSSLRGAGKAETIGRDAAAGEGPASYEELSGMAEGTMEEWEDFTGTMWNQIFDSQMVADYQKRMGEIQKEVQKIISMAKAGQVDPEYVLIALAKVNVTKNGVLMTWLGKKAFATNETMTRVADDLRATSPTDPKYFGDLQYAQAKTRDGSFQLQMLVSDLQKVMQDVASVLEQVHGFMGEINRTRREIITKVAAQ